MSAPAPEAKASSKTTAPARAGRILWFVAFYAMSLVTFTALVYALRYVVKG